MIRENSIITSGTVRIERSVMRYHNKNAYARFAWLGTEELPLPDPWWACTVFREDGHTKIQLSGEEYLSVEQAWVLGLALSMAIEWAAEEEEKYQATRP